MDYLNVLDEIEEIRQKAAEMPDAYPADYVARVCAAIIAQAAGFKGRTDWTDELKNEKISINF